MEVQENGTMAEVTTTCANPKSGKTVRWFSQPYMTGTMIPAGNFLLSFGILVAGTSATKVLRVLKHMGLKCISLSTYFMHQRVSGHNFSNITVVYNIQTHGPLYT